MLLLAAYPWKTPTGKAVREIWFEYFWKRRSKEWCWIFESGRILEEIERVCEYLVRRERWGAKMRKSVLGFILKSYIRTGRRVVGDCNVRSRNEFVAEALKFYMGYLLAGKAENYFLQSLASVLTGTVQDSENRLARMDF